MRAQCVSFGEYKLSENVPNDCGGNRKNHWCAHDTPAYDEFILQRKIKGNQILSKGFIWVYPDGWMAASENR